MYRWFPIILGFLLVTVFFFACCSVLVFIIADRAPTAAKFYGRKTQPNEMTAKMRTTVTSVCDKVVHYDEE